MCDTPTFSVRRSHLVRAALGAALLLTAARGAAAQTKVTAGAAELIIGGRVQTQFNTTTADDQPPTDLLLRRVFFEAAAKVNDFVGGKVQVDVAGNRIQLKDAFARLSFDPAFQIVAGNQHRPFSLLSLTSDARMAPIERAVSIRGIPAVEETRLLESLGYVERDIGIVALGRAVNAPVGVDYTLGVFRGPLQGKVGPQDSYQYTARLSVQPAAWARMGGAWSARDFADPASPDLAKPELRKGNAFVADLDLGRFERGPHLMAEVSHADVDPFRDATFTGAQAWLSYRTQPLGRAVSGIEPIFRVSTAKIDGPRPLGAADGTLLTPGVNIYFGGLNRLMLDYDVWRSREAENAGSFKAMLQVVF
jgi:hypothetical protein